MFNKTTIDTITKLAVQYKYEPEALLAVVDVESAGVAFWNINGEQKPAVRFEGHYFYKRLQGADRDKAVREGLASPNAGVVKNPDSFEGRYALIKRAAKINADAAHESVSWGLGQVMGANWKDLGFKSVADLVNFSQSLTGQVELMLKFIAKNNLKAKIDAHDWAGFALGYNGKGYKANAYDVKMAKAYDKYKGGHAVAEEADYMQLQMMLNKINPEYELTVDGFFGANTVTALRDFQLKNGLKVDGSYGPLTKAKVEASYLAIVNDNSKKMANAGTVVNTAGIAIAEAAKQIEPFKDMSQIVQWVFIGLLVLGVVFTLKAYLWPKKVA